MTKLLIQVKTPLLSTNGDMKHLIAGDFTTNDEGTHLVAETVFGTLEIPTADNNIKMRIELNDAGLACLEDLKDEPFGAVFL